MSGKPTYEELEKRVRSLQKECVELNRLINLLLDSENKYRTFFENSMDAMFITKPDGLVLEANAAACEMFGYTEEELIQGGRNAVVDPDDQRLLSALKERERKGRFAGDLNFKRKDGTELPAEITSVIFKTKDGDERASIIVRDISERKRAEKALRESEAFTRAVMDRLPIGLAVNSVDPSVDFVYMNDNFPRFYRTTREALADPNAFWDVVYEDPVFREKIMQRVLEDCASNDPERMHWEDVPITRKGEETVFINARNTPVPEKSLMISTVWDVSDRKRIEENLKISEEKYRSLFESIDEGFCVIEVIYDAGGIPVDYRFLQVNPAFEKHTGLRDAEGKTMRSLAPDHEAYWFETYGRIAMTGEPERFVKEARALNRWYDVYAFRMDEPESRKVAILFYDITERKQAEEAKEKLQAQFHQAQKMEAVGTLAGGIAHDFNNVLTAIFGFGEMLKTRIANDPEAISDLDQILVSAERASTLTRQILTFARRQIIEVGNLDLNRVIADLEKLLRKVTREDIEIHTCLAEGLPTIRADQGQIEQVLMNLCLNARDAMPDGGQLMVETSEALVGGEYVKKYPYMKPGRYAVLSVSDTGIGMDEDIREHVFEPFFTTKGDDKGTGLGLAVVYGIVKQHNGFIHVYSEPGKGTTFRTYFPALDVPPDRKVVASPGIIHGGSETILLAEDDESIGRLAERILSSYGYRVLVASNGEEAVDLFHRHEEEIAMAVLDVVMPKKGGKQAYNEMAKTNPGLKVLFMSGYSATAIHESFVLLSGLSFLQKPFSPTMLARKVREVLDGNRGRT
ncbi:MAG: PAS domain S-box protein [Deltaproteobacteria bacterium]|nr:PAS domain S-box protein [Deltaproteobacteria bacterium]